MGRAGLRCHRQGQDQVAPLLETRPLSSSTPAHGYIRYEEDAEKKTQNTIRDQHWTAKPETTLPSASRLPA